MSYLLDANVIMSAKNLHYGLDSVRPCGSGWCAKGNTGAVFSIDQGMLKNMRHRFKAPLPLRERGWGEGE